MSNGFFQRQERPPESRLTAAELQCWSERLLTAAGRTLPEGFPSGGEEILRVFSDEHGDRRAVDEPLLAWMMGVTPRRAGGQEPPDVRLWRTLAEGTPLNECLLEGGRAAPLLDLPEGTTIEVWTEAELSALHALWWIARRDARADLADRCMAAAAWHMERIQPDNATNHPWAIHVFLVHAQSTGAADGRMYAETMLHNCQVGLGRPERFSAVILLDAGRALAAER